MPMSKLEGQLGLGGYDMSDGQNEIFNKNKQIEKEVKEEFV